MKYRALTVAREFGSGGALVAQSIASRLGWKLLDDGLIEEIACAAHVDSKVVSRFDEHVEGWLHRINRQAIRGAAMAGGIELDQEKCFDEDTMFDLTRKVMEQA